MEQPLYIKWKIFILDLRLFFNSLISLKFQENPFTLWKQVRSLKKLVDEGFYYASYPDMKGSNLPAYVHFIVYGYAEKRTFNPYFDSDIFYSKVLEKHPKRMHPLLFAVRENLLLSMVNIEMLIRRHTGKYQELKDVAFPSDENRVIAWYLPQFHPMGENDLAWGKGFTEWSNVVSARPCFDGHYQPKLPGALGFYDLRRKETLKEQIQLARHAGLYGFCFHHYWFHGKKVLHTPLDHFRDDPNLDFPFCLHWANEPWTRRWDGLNRDAIIEQKHSLEDSLAFIRDITWALKDKRYMRFNGRPMLGVYRPGLIPDMPAVIGLWREHCLEQGVGEIFLFTTQAFGNTVESALSDGFDGFVEYPPHVLVPPIRNDLYDTSYKGNILDYREAKEIFLKKSQASHSFPTFRGVMLGWDNVARSEMGNIFDRAFPEEYRQWLESVCQLAGKDTYEGERYVFINAWNEWAEGTYLEPDARYGSSVLNATASVLDSAPALPHVLFAFDPDDAEQVSELEQVLSENRKAPKFRPVVFAPKPFHHIGTLNSLAPFFTCFEHQSPAEVRTIFRTAGYWKFQIGIVFDAKLAKPFIPFLSDICTHLVLSPSEKAMDPIPDSACQAKIWRTAAKEGVPPGEWVVVDQDGQRAVAGQLLESTADTISAVNRLSCIVLPDKARIHWSELIQMRKQSLFPIDFFIPGCVDSAPTSFPTRKLAASNVRTYLETALRESRGEYVWLIRPGDRPDPNLPAALLACFIGEDIGSARSYAPDEKLAGKNSDKHTYCVAGDMFVLVADISQSSVLPSPTIAIFRRRALLDALQTVHDEEEAFLEMLFKAVYANSKVAIVPSCLLLPLERDSER